MPEIIALPHAEAKGVGDAVVSTRRDWDGRRAMYVSTIYPGDTMHFDPHTPDIVMADWQARLLAHLRQCKWSVVHKPHPESAILPPVGFERLFFARPLPGRFEDVTSEADVFVFDKINSTAFSCALSVGLPIVYVEIDGWPWLPEAWEALRRRVAVVKAERDYDKRITLDWNELDEAMKRARDLVHDNYFYERYVA